jgi:hypothetical protein
MPLRLFGNGGKPGSDMLMLQMGEENNKHITQESITVFGFGDLNWVVKLNRQK